MSDELEKFNTVLRKVLSVPREELLKRERLHFGNYVLDYRGGLNGEKN